MSKVKVSELTAGMEIKLPRGKVGIVTDVKNIDVALPRTITTSVVSYKVKGDDGDDDAILEKHAAASSKIEVVPVSRWQRFKNNFRKAEVKEPAPKLVALPHFVKATAKKEEAEAA